MKYRIHYTTPIGTEDSFVVEGDSVENIRESAHEELGKRAAIDPWSEELQ